MDAAPLRNITPFDEAVLELEDLLTEARAWADGEPITTQEQCDALDKLDKAIAAAGKKLDALRVEEKRPLDEQVDAIQARYNPFIQPKRGKVDIARSSLNPMRAAFKLAEKQRKDEIARKAAEDAARIRAEAEAEIRASKGNMEARETAEDKLALAKEAEAFAKRQEKRAETGNGLRAVPRVEITDLSAACRHYFPIKRDAFADLIMGLALAEARNGRRGSDIPGIVITEEMKAL